MKLILCAECQDVIKLLVGKQRFCDCGKSYGEYMDDGLNAKIGGRAIPIGFANNSLLGAIRCRPESGQGSKFEAFVIPEKCQTITPNAKLTG